MKALHKLLAAFFITANATATTHAGAEPTAALVRLPPKEVVDLRRDITQARAADLRPFVAVNGIVTSAAAVDARSRGRKAPIALYLAKLGPGALMPMLEMLALDAPKGVSTEGAPAIRRDLVEAVGLLRDPRSLPVLTSILEDTTEDEEMTRTAAEAVARIGTDEAEARVIAALQNASGDRARAILGGMGECRRLRVVDLIAARLRAATDDATVRVAARALGRAGNAWAWKTLPDRGEEARLRETAARALVDAFVRHDGEARAAADNALMVIDDPHTPMLIAEARRRASPDTMKALDALSVRFANNPSR